MRKKYIRGVTAVIATVPLLLSACDLMPVEEALPQAPIVHEYKEEKYSLAEVTKGDIFLTETVKCSYKPALREWLSFSVPGRIIKGVYVTEGDAVKAGDLIAELELGDLSGDIAGIEYDIYIQEIEKSHIEENRRLEKRRQDALLAQYDKKLEDVRLLMKKLEAWEKDPNASEKPTTKTMQQLKVQEEDLLEDRAFQEQKKKTADDKYAQQIKTIDNSLYIQRIRLEEEKENLVKMRIFATIDGIVTYAMDVSDNQKSVLSENIATITNLESTAFEVSGSGAAYFPVGTEVEVQASRKTIKTVSVHPSDLGLEETEEFGKTRAYLKPVQADATLEDNTNGTISVVLDSRENVLYLPKKTVYESEGKHFVYILGEDGLRQMKDVTVGMLGDEYIEIVSGLQEGDLVIAE